MQEEFERLTREEIFERDKLDPFIPKKWTKEEIDEMEGPIIEFSDNETSYRRGFRQGFIAARQNQLVTENEVIQWSNGNEETCPPGSTMDGTHLYGLKKDDEHRFFINRLKKVWNE